MTMLTKQSANNKQTATLGQRSRQKLEDGGWRMGPKMRRSSQESAPGIECKIWRSKEMGYTQGKVCTMIKQ